MRRKNASSTILDVARRAEVSLGTASNVLNGRGNVSAERRARVEAAMAALGYVPNSLAQSLRRRSSRVVGLCVPSTSSAYFGALLDAFENVAGEQGYELMQVLSRGDPALELRRVKALLSRKVDGLIIIPTATPGPALETIATSGVPAVVVDRLTDDRRFDYVTIDDRRAMHEAACHLLDLGHRRLLYIFRDPRLPTTQQRIEGFLETVAGQPGAVAELMHRDPDEANFAHAVGETLRRDDAPTAIISSNSSVTVSLLHVFRTLGVRCPQDLSMLAFDESNWADLVTPPLTIIRHPTPAMASEVWARLARRMQRGRVAVRRLMLPAELVVRESTAPPRDERLTRFALRTA